MLRQTTINALFQGIAVVISATAGVSANEWQRLPAPVLQPGPLNDWDDFQVADPSVVRTRDDWRMYYVGARLDENGYASAIGVAVSDDGRTWRKDPRNPLILPDEPLESRTTRRLLTPAVSVLADGSWLMACVELDHNEGRRGLRVLRSPDGFDWRIDHDAERSLRQAASSQALVSPSVCPNPHRRERIQLWCLKSRDANRVADVRNAAIVMLQSTDGTSWKQLLERPFTEIEPTGFVRDVRVAGSDLTNAITCGDALENLRRASGNGTSVVQRYFAGSSARSDERYSSRSATCCAVKSRTRNSGISDLVCGKTSSTSDIGIRCSLFCASRITIS